MEQLYELNLRDYWSIFLKRKWEVLISFFVIFVSIVIYTTVQVPLYRATVILKVETSLFLPSDTIFPGRGAWQTTFEPYDYTKQIVSRPIVEKAARELGWIDDFTSDAKKEKVISEITNKVNAAHIENTSMIRITAQFDNPEKAMLIANKVSEVFKRVNRDQKNEQSRNVRVFVEQRLGELSASLKDQDERLRVLTTKGVVGSAVNILASISEAEQRLAEMSAKYTSFHPNIIVLKEEIEKLKNELRKLPEEEFEYGVLKRDTAINEALYSSLKTNLQQAQIREAENIDNIILVNPAVLPGEPYFPNKAKNYTVGIVLGLILGISTALISEHMDTSIGRVDDIENFIKIGVVGIIPYCVEQYREKGEERRKRSIFRKKVSRNETWKPTLMLELEKTDSSSLFLEAFRLLGVNMQVLFGKEGRIKNKIIMITSCKPEEGKTVIVSTLGLIMAQMGYRVLVLDADVRRAHVHKSFGLKQKENGLTDILTGKISADQAVRTATDIMVGTANIERILEKPWINNLNILTAGTTFSNTINLFNSSKLDETLAFFRNKYDLVLVDTSPILAVSEPSMLLTKVDGVLLVYRAGSTSRLALRRAKLQIESIKGKGSISGIILNNVTPEIGMDTYYYYNKRYYTDEAIPARHGKIAKERGRKDV